MKLERDLASTGPTPPSLSDQPEHISEKRSTHPGPSLLHEDFWKVWCQGTLGKRGLQLHHPSGSCPASRSLFTASWFSQQLSWPRFCQTRPYCSARPASKASDKATNSLFQIFCAAQKGHKNDWRTSAASWLSGSPGFGSRKRYLLRLSMFCEKAIETIQYSAWIEFLDLIEERLNLVRIHATTDSQESALTHYLVGKADP